MEKEIEKYFNGKLKEYQKAVYEELINMFGSECEIFIREALEVPVVYQVDKSTLKFYDEITDQLNGEEQSIVDYFKEKLGENDEYIIGSSIGKVTDLMKKYSSSRYHREAYEEFVSCCCISNPYRMYLRDESYIQALIYKIGLSLKVNDIKFKICENISWTLSMEIVNRLHLKGFYLFDSKSQMEEYESIRKEVFAKAREEKDYDMDRELLTPILDVLPLYFTNRNEFYRVVGERNYAMLMDGIGRKDKEAVYSSIDRMKESMDKNRYSEIVMIDINTITNALKSMREKQQNPSLETENVEEKRPTIESPKPIIPRIERNIRLLEGLDLQPIRNKIDNLKFNIDNTNNIQEIIDIIGEKKLFIDEDEKNTLDPPNSPKM